MSESVSQSVSHSLSHCSLPLAQSRHAHKHHGLHKENTSEIKMIAHCREGTKKELHKIEKIQSPLLILIGPEGDFSEKEIEIARTNSFIEISLGNQRLRTETAGLFACNSVEILRRTNQY